MALTPEQLTKVKKYIELYNEDIIDNDNLDFVIEDSAEFLSEPTFGSQYPKAVAYLTLHTLTIAAQTSGEGGSAGDATGGAVIQRTIGPITIKWASPKDSSNSKYWDAYKTTKYGLMLLDLIRLCTLGKGISVTGAWEDL